METLVTLSMWRMGMAAIFSSTWLWPWRRRPEISVNWSTNSTLRGTPHSARTARTPNTLAEQLQAVCRVVLCVKLARKGKLFGSVTRYGYCSRHLKESGFEVDRRNIQLDASRSESVGDFTVPVRLPARPRRC